MKKWTKEEDAFLLSASSSHTLKQLAAHLDRGTRGVDHRIRKLGLSYIDEHTTDEFKKQASDRQIAYAADHVILGHSPWLITDDGRQCSYTGEGNCGNTFYSWDAYNKGNNARGYTGWCRSCSSVQRLVTPVEERREQKLVTTLRMYSMTLTQYRGMLAVYDGNCWLCKNPETYIDPQTGSIQRLKVDHNHSCCPEQGRSCGNCIRGLLCRECNSRVMARVDKIGLINIQNYLAGGYVY